MVRPQKSRSCSPSQIQPQMVGSPPFPSLILFPFLGLDRDLPPGPASTPKVKVDLPREQAVPRPRRRKLQLQDEESESGAQPENAADDLQDASAPSDLPSDMALLSPQCLFWARRLSSLGPRSACADQRPFPLPGTRQKDCLRSEFQVQEVFRE